MNEYLIIVPLYICAGAIGAAIAAAIMEKIDRREQAKREEVEACLPRCPVCGQEYTVTKEMIYTAAGPASIADLLSPTKETIECVDCPNCGHQIEVGTKLPRCERKNEQTETLIIPYKDA